MDTPIVRLTVEYDGTAYCGVQRQSHAPSVQSALEQALSKIAGAPVEIAVAGRTDTGVHASAQVASFKVPEAARKRPLRTWRLGGNRYLADDICILDAARASDDFHARFSALSRRYLYLLSEHVPARGLNARRMWHVGRSLDIEAMQRALQAILGERDFSAFRSANCNARSPYRNVMRTEVSRQGSLIVCDITANAFLHRMVRMIVGVLVPIGAARAPQSSLADALERGTFDASLMPTAPAHGLYLCGVDYPDWRVFRAPGPLLGAGASDTMRTP